ncbi:helix-turn-helix transcriptional regulator [Paenibacillus sp.]|uniref:helix-turn-helix domain-containing protein n=1 Tax=Paenibacillus sp. TaxID=58172 RepID=UPI0028A98983|nr:helix-turn-helix transcriptional regulator [Paenibacillus sp.]
MTIDAIKVGKQISYLRKVKNLTQSELGERLNVSFQAVSKWERGETLPDTAILIDLANVLGTTVDTILTGGEKVMEYKGKITVEEMREGINSLEKVGQLLGRDNIIYRYAIDGINEKMNMDVEEAFVDDYKRESLICEAIIQNMMSGKYIDITDIKNNLKYDHFKKIVCDYAAKYGLV